MQTQQSQNDTALPRAVRRQMARLNEKLEAKASASNSAPAPQPTEGDAGVTNGDTSHAAPAPSPAPAASAPAPAADPRDNDPAYWKARFKVTEGMLRKSQEDLRAAQDEADRTIQELRNQMAELQARAPSTSTAKVDITAFFTPEQIERFGAEQCEAMASAAIKAARSQADELIKQEVEPIKKKAQADQRNAQADREAGFWNALAEKTPDYPDINAKPEWLAWLAERDDRTKMVRQDILDAHRRNLDAEGVSALFEEFRTLQGSGKHRAEPPVAPARSGGENADAGGAGAASGARGYPTPNEIRDFHKRAATIKNPRDPRFVTPKERQEFEARLQLPKPA